MTAPPDIWIQTLTGRALDLMAPTADMIDLTGEIPEVLARVPRFGGHVAGGAYSVAQHCVLGADAILHKTGNLDLARAFLLHDAHEYAMGDIASPVADALCERTGLALARRMPTVSEQARRNGAVMAREAIRSLKRDLDAAIYAAAGLPWPLPAEMAAAVLEWDLAMLKAERAYLLTAPPYPWHSSIETIAPAPLPHAIRIWSWPMAAGAYRTRLMALLPHLKASAL